MNDIPAFTECGGVSTLILREIPYKNTAFIMVRAFEKDSLNEHLQEAASLCRFAGAKSVYAAAEDGKLFPEKEPDYKMLRLRLDLEQPQPSTPLPFESLTEANTGKYISIYNNCFGDMLSAETFNEKKARVCLANSHRECRIYYNEDAAAISDIEFHDSSAELNAIAVLPQYRGGFGSRVLQSVAEDAAKRGAKSLFVNVMSTNSAALRLYEKFGFKLEKVLSCWYRTV